MVYMLRHTHEFSLYFVAHTYSNSSTLCRCCCCIFVCEQTSIPKRQTYTKTISSFIYSRLACVSCGWMVYWCVSVIHYPHSYSMYVCMHVERCVVQLHVREQTYIHFSLPYTHLAYTSYSCFIHNTAIMVRIHKDRQYNDNDNDNDTDVYHLHFVFHRAVCFSYRIHKSCVRVFWQLCTVKQSKRKVETERKIDRKKEKNNNCRFGQ